MYMHVGITTGDPFAKARAVPSTWSDRSGEPGLFSQRATPNCAPHHPQHWHGMGEMQHLHSHPTASLHLHHSFHVVYEKREEMLLLQQSVTGCIEVNCKLCLFFGHPGSRKSKNGFKVVPSSCWAPQGVFLSCPKSEANHPGTILWQEGLPLYEAQTPLKSTCQAFLNISGVQKKWHYQEALGCKSATHRAYKSVHSGRKYVLYYQIVSSIALTVITFKCLTTVH